MNISEWRTAMIRWGRRRVGLAVIAAVNIVLIAILAPDWALAANAFLVLLTIKGAAFVGLYSVRSNWRATSAGRAVMALVACITTICAIGTAGWIVGNYPGRVFVRLGAFVAIGLVLMNLLLALIQVQNSERDEEES